MQFEQFIKDVGVMPDNCNSFSRLNLDDKAFSKFNYQWNFAPRGAKPRLNAIKKKKREYIVNGINVCIKIDRYLFEFIKSQAHHKSIETKQDCNANDLIRLALATAFPLPSQIDIFGDQK